MLIDVLWPAITKNFNIQYKPKILLLVKKVSLETGEKWQLVL